MRNDAVVQRQDDRGGLTTEEHLAECRLKNRSEFLFFFFSEFDGFLTYILIRVVEGWRGEGKIGSRARPISGDCEWWVSWSECKDQKL